MSDVVTLAVAISAIIGAATAVGFTVRWLWRLLVRMSRLIDALMGEPPVPGISAGRPGVVEQIAALREAMQAHAADVADLRDRMAYVEAQMRPNGGSSMRDKVDRLAATTDGGTS